MYDATNLRGQESSEAYLRRPPIDAYIEQKVREGKSPLDRTNETIDRYLEAMARRYATVKGGYGSLR